MRNRTIKQITKLMMITIGLAACMSAQAALCNPDVDRLEINIPNLRPGIDLSVTLAYDEANYHNTGLVIPGSTATPYPNGTTDNAPADQDFGYGFMLGRRFCDTGNDLRFSYFQYETTLCSKAKGEGWAAVGNVDDENFLHSTNRSSLNIDFTLYTYDLEVAQRINIGQRSGLRMLAGLSLHKVKESKRAGYTNDESSLSAELRSEFDGIGPRLGMDYDCYIANNFGFFSRANGALLIGSIDSRTTITSGESLEIKNKGRCVVVPNINVQLGLDWTYCISPNSNVSFELGYEIRHYFDCVNEIHVIAGSNNANYINNINSVTFHGCYLTVRGEM